ncbi:hypothetical protein DUNSADRAFT_15654 [Dunaliella salina]|uniref:Encoded protein n=1 Tax=Dunaliella salina TaxID=3046 RepID=A0ABQ7G4Z8_DUNSA|nr:hypothetical protein DUNSADRAFT_15654 [Dunaliella salina]|eukprot:KAF5829679.1 hypothetical protein DUNSADRAFT_15654 [Dunaliella salina]
MSVHALFVSSYTGKHPERRRHCLAPSDRRRAGGHPADHSKLHFVNTLSLDVTAWHPLTVEELLEASPLQRKLLRLISTTPLKLLASIGDLARSFQHWDLKTYYELARPSVIAGEPHVHRCPCSSVCVCGCLGVWVCGCVVCVGCVGVWVWV